MTNLTQYINNNIQLSPISINQILLSLSITSKFLVFGLGYDSELWYNAADTYFVEHDYNYIQLNNNINFDHIVYYNYGDITVENSYLLSNIDKYSIPNKLLSLAPFDVILIDGPPGYRNDLPGRLLPIYWSSNILSKNNTIIFIDDSDRNLESYSINKFLSIYQQKHFKTRLGFTEVIISKIDN
jgi:hypothetical protein